MSELSYIKGDGTPKERDYETIKSPVKLPRRGLFFRAPVPEKS